MKNSTLWTLCTLLALVFAVSTTGCEREQEEETQNEQASAEEPTEKQGAALTSTESSTESDETKVVQQEQYAPEIVDLEFKPSKFVKCGESLEICANARDRNGDTVQFDWSQQAGDDPIETFSVTDSIQTGQNAEECVSFMPNKGFNQIQVIVSQDKEGQGSSMDSISFPLHVGDGSC